MHVAAVNHGEYGSSWNSKSPLLENGGDPNTADPHCATPVHYAARNESRSAVQIMKLLLENGENPNTCIGDGGLCQFI